MYCVYNNYYGYYHIVIYIFIVSIKCKIVYNIKYILCNKDKV